MIFSVGLILVVGLLGGKLSRLLHLPEIVGMMVGGILVGPYVFGLLDSEFLAFSGDLRTLAFIIILCKAGMMLDLRDLKKIGRPALLMCFLPATFELGAYLLFAPKLLGISLLEADIIGAIMGAVSPAVVIPRMTKLIEDDWGTKQGIPQMIVAGASADDVYVVVLFTSLVTLASGGSVAWTDFAAIPVSIVSGILFGCLMGLVVIWIFNHSPSLPPSQQLPLDFS